MTPYDAWKLSPPEDELGDDEGYDEWARDADEVDDD